MTMVDDDNRDYDSRAFTIGLSGGATSGARPTLLALCRLLRTSYGIAIVTGEVPPPQDGGKAFLMRHKALPAERISVVPTGGSVHAEFDLLMEMFRPDLLFVEGAGSDPVSSREVADFTIHVVDADADGIRPEESDDAAHADLLVINRTHPGPPLDVSLNPVAQDAARLRGDAPVVFAQVRYSVGVIDIAKHVLVGWRQASAPAAWTPSSVPGERRDGWMTT